MASVQVDELLQKFEHERHKFDYLRKIVVAAFESDPALNATHAPVIHSIKSRLKDKEHLRAKLLRKLKDGKTINAENLFAQVTDLAGVRILHLHFSQIKQIHEFIVERASKSEWVLAEAPVAYSWDPDAKSFFQSIDVNVSEKESQYTSVHYLIKPNATSETVCEIQVRTLLEELWGEIDHRFNYPVPCESVFVIEQLRVLAKLVSTGSRLADSIFRLAEHSALHESNGNRGSTDLPRAETTIAR
jgi:putative GTP pyrophosphokinase